MYRGMCNCAGATKLFFQVGLRKKYLHVDVGIVVVIIIVILKRKLQIGLKLTLLLLLLFMKLVLIEMEFIRKFMKVKADISPVAGHAASDFFLSSFLS